MAESAGQYRVAELAQLVDVGGGTSGNPKVAVIAASPGNRRTICRPLAHCRDYVLHGVPVPIAFRWPVPHLRRSLVAGDPRPVFEADSSLRTVAGSFPSSDQMKNSSLRAVARPSRAVGAFRGSLPVSVVVFVERWCRLVERENR